MNKAEPCALGKTPVLISIGLTVRVSLPSILGSPSRILVLTILASRLEGQKMGVNSTPSFFLNGKKLDGLVDLEMLLKHIY